MSQQPALAVQRTTALSLIQDQAALGNVNTFANYMAQGDLMTPQQFKGKPADCFMLTMQAMQWGMNPLSVAPEVYAVNGNLAYGSKLIIAVILQSGMVEPRPYYNAIGEWSQLGPLQGQRFANEQGLGVQVGFKFKGDELPTFGETIYLANQQNRNSPLWKTNPYQQLCYLGAKYWSRLYMPGATMGLYSEDEAQPMASEQPAERDITPGPTMDAGGEAVNFEKAAVETITPVKEAHAPSPTETAPLEGELVDQENTQTRDENPGGDDLAKAAQTQQPAKAAPAGNGKPQPGDLDDKRTPFDPEIHSGTKLNDGSWRLNKVGQERKKAAEAQQKAEEEAAAKLQAAAQQQGQGKASGFAAKSQQQPAQDKLHVVAIHAESIEFFGKDAVEVTQYNQERGQVLINGDWFQIEDENNTYLVFCDANGSFPEADEDNPFAP